MKKFFAFAMMFAAAAGAFVSCTKDIEPEVTTPSLELSGRTKTITVNAVVAETRTELNDHNLQWADGDTFGVFCVAGDKKTILGYKEVNVDMAQLIMPVETKFLYCIYPYNEAYVGNYPVTEPEEESDITPAASLDNIAVSLPNTALTAFDGKLPMVAKGDAPEVGDKATVVFTPLASIVELNVYADGDAEVGELSQITVSTGVAAAGKEAYVDFTSETPELKNLTTSNFVVGVTEKTAPDTKEKGLKSYLYFANGVYENFAVTVLTKQDAGVKNYTFNYENLDLTQLGRTLNLNLANQKVDTKANTLLWDFSDAGWENNAAGTTTVKDGLTCYGAAAYNTKGYYQIGSGGSDMKQQYFQFTAPVSGTLKLKVSGSGGIRTDYRTMMVLVGNDLGEKYSFSYEDGGERKSRDRYGNVMYQECTIASSDAPVILEYNVTIYDPTTTVKICSEQGHTIYSIEYTYHKIEPTVWDFSSEAWTSVYPVRTEDDTNENYVRRTDFDQTVDGLRLLAGGQYIDFRDKDKCIQPGGKGSQTTRVFSFTATSSGNLFITTSNTGPSNLGERKVMVMSPGKFTSNQSGTYVPTDPDTPEEGKNGLTQIRRGDRIDITEETTVYIYPSDDGVRFYSIEFDGSVKK